MADQWAAVIGAGGALIGVALTGAFTLLRGRQELRDKDAERREQRQIMHREARRQAYLEVLTKYHEADRRLEALWKLKPLADSETSVPAIVFEAESAIKDLREACANVILEGPDEVARHAHKLWVACQDVWDATNVISLLHHGSDERLFVLATDEQTALERARHAARGQFMRAASDAIGGRAPGFS